VFFREKDVLFSRLEQYFVKTTHIQLFEKGGIKKASFFVVEKEVSLWV